MNDPDSLSIIHSGSLSLQPDTHAETLKRGASHTRAELFQHEGEKNKASDPSPKFGNIAQVSIALDSSPRSILRVLRALRGEFSLVSFPCKAEPEATTYSIQRGSFTPQCAARSSRSRHRTPLRGSRRRERSTTLHHLSESRRSSRMRRERHLRRTHTHRERR